jgi:hypothetical protein
LVSGTGTWLRGSRRLIRFRVTSFQAFPKGDIRSAFDELRQSGGDAWDKIDDPNGHLLRVTGE